MTWAGGEMDASRHGGRSSTMNDARSYVTEVKDTFHDQSDKYDMFIKVLNDFGAQRIDCSTMRARVKELFRGHSDLIIRFNTFMHHGCKITLDNDEEDLASSTAGNY